jgi:ribosomal protein L11 methyltransferase
MEVTQEKWTEITVTVDTKDIETAGNIANMVVPYGIYIEDYSALEEETMEIAHIDLIEASLLQKDRTKGIIHIYISPEENPAEAVSFLEERLQSAGIAYTLGTDLCAMEDWVNNWKKYFHQFYVDDILIIPSWEEVKPEDEGKMIVHIDPGTAFGTGMHETTQLCIRQLRKYVTEDTRILDVGCGSGILGMLALMFGAKYSVGTDLDPCAIDATYENMEVNGISKDKYEVMIGNIIDDKEVQDKVGYGCYDIVVANILADVLVPLTPVIVNQLKDGGIYVTSGIIEDKEETVKAAVEAAGLTVLEVHHQGEWVSVTARKETKA